MNPLKKLKLNIKAKAEQSKMSRLEQRFGKSGLAGQCMNCRWLVYRTEKPRNWVCRCPPDRYTGVFIGNVCQSFEFGEHPNMVVMHNR